jgi:hypothetical protein
MAVMINDSRTYMPVAGEKSQHTLSFLSRLVPALAASEEICSTEQSRDLGIAGT